MPDYRDLVDRCHPLLGLVAPDITTPVRTGGVTGSVGSFGMTRRRLDGSEKMHKGVDLLAVEGWPVFACTQGVIERAGWEAPDEPGQGYGKRLYLRHGGTVLVCAHLTVMNVRDGSVVAPGMMIGRVGRTGNVGQHTPTHLHFEVRVNGNPIDPELWLAGMEGGE